MSEKPFGDIAEARRARAEEAPKNAPLSDAALERVRGGAGPARGPDGRSPGYTMGEGAFYGY